MGGRRQRRESYGHNLIKVLGKVILDQEELENTAVRVKSHVNMNQMLMVEEDTVCTSSPCGQDRSDNGMVNFILCMCETWD